MKRSKKIEWRYLGLSVLSILCFLVIWYVVSTRTMLPSPIDAIQEALAMTHKRLAQNMLGEHILASVFRITSGFLISTVLGITLGMIMGCSRFLRAIIKPLFDLIRPVPALAWIPLFIIWFGIGETTNIIIICVGATVPITLNTYFGITTVDPLLESAGRVLGASRRQMLFSVILPDAIPAIIAGLRTALSGCWMAVVAAEMVVANKGLGFVILSAMQTMKFNMVVATMFYIAIGCAVYNFIFTKLERVLCPWEHLNEK